MRQDQGVSAMIKTALTSLELRELAADCEKFNKTPPIESFEYQRLYLRITRYAPRCLGEAADELDRLSRIEDKYTNLCAVLNEQAGEIQRLQQVLAFWLPHMPADPPPPHIDEKLESSIWMLAGYNGP